MENWGTRFSVNGAQTVNQALQFGGLTTLDDANGKELDLTALYY
jgi:hypothetical protein